MPFPYRPMQCWPGAATKFLPGVSLLCFGLHLVLGPRQGPLGVCSRNGKNSTLRSIRCAQRSKLTSFHRHEGFDFLGFNVRKYNGKPLIKPSKDSKLSILRKVKELLDSNKTAKVEAIIRILNPLLHGWANYYSSEVSKKAFTYCDYRIHQMLWRWATRRHPMKNAKWVKAKYFARRGDRDWVFTDGHQDIYHLSKVRIIRHIKIQGSRSPYRTSDEDYFDRRRKQLLLKRLDGFQKRVVKKTDGRCGLCGRFISEEHFRKWQQNGENSIVFHSMISPRLGGRNTVENVFVTHRWCREQLYRQYGRDTMPDNPERFLSAGESIVNGKIVLSKRIQSR